MDMMAQVKSSIPVLIGQIIVTMQTHEKDWIKLASGCVHEYTTYMNSIFRLGSHLPNTPFIRRLKIL